MPNQNEPELRAIIDVIIARLNDKPRTCADWRVISRQIREALKYAAVRASEAKYAPEAK